MRLRWLTNHADPRIPDWEDRFIHNIQMTREESIRLRREWLADKVIGDPKPEELTVQQLKEQNMVGIYRRVDE